MNYFEQDLQKAHDFHGHVCSGIVFGVRMARIGLNHLGIEDPGQNRDFIVFVEADRCVADAVSSVTGCSLGRRRLKWLDYGKMATTFVDINTNEGIRIVTAAKQQIGDQDDVVAFWSAFPDEELFRTELVTVNLKPEDLPGKPSRKVSCATCGEFVMDHRDLLIDGKIFCKACAQGAYYQKRP